MEFIYSQTILLGILLFLGFHFAAGFTKGIISKILNYVNIALHIIFIIPMMNEGIPIEEGVLIYMISLFVYTFLNMLLYKSRIEDEKKKTLAEADGKASIAKPEAKAEPKAQAPIANPETKAEPKAQAPVAKPEAKAEPKAQAPAEKPETKAEAQRRESRKEKRKREREESRRQVADASPVKTAAPTQFRFEPIAISDSKSEDGENKNDGVGGDGK